MGGILMVRALGLGQVYSAAAAAAALALSLAMASLLKARLLSRILAEPINNWRWSLLWGVVPATLVGGSAVALLPEWLGILVGLFGTVVVYVWAIWFKGFGPEDRILLRRNVAS